MVGRSRTEKLFNGLSTQTFITIIMGVLEITLFAIMSRLLSKTVFGYYAALMGIMNVFLSLSEAGLGAAVIQKKDISDGHVNTAFTMSLILGSSFSLIVFLFAPILAELVADNTLTKPLRIMSITLLLNSLNSIGNGLLLKKLQFKKAGIVTISSYFVSGVIGIIMALNGYGLYSIVAYVVLYPAFVCFMIYMLLIKIPQLTIVKKDAKSIISFGGWLTAGVIVNNLTHQLDKLLLSRWISVEVLGAYNRPAGFVSTISSKINGIFDTVLFPILSDIQNDRFKVPSVFVRAFSLLNALSVILASLFFFNSELIIRVFFGSNWMELVPVLRIVSISVIFNVDGRLVDCFFRSLAFVKTGFYIRLLSLFITLGSLFIGARYGIVGVAIGLVMANIITVIVKIVVLTIKIEIKILPIIKTWLRSLVSAVPQLLSGVLFLLLVPDGIVSEILFAFFFIVLSFVIMVGFPSLLGKEYKASLYPIIRKTINKIIFSMSKNDY